MINELQEMLKNKIEFKELDVETKKIYAKKIDDIRYKIYDYILQENMFCQDEELNNMNIKQNIIIKDHYSSFYLICKSPIELMHDINKDYLDSDNLKLYEGAKKIYNKILKHKTDNFNDYYEASHEFYKIYEKLEEKVNILIDGITRQLREYENVTDQQINEYIEYNDEFINDNIFSNLYIDPEELKNNIYKIYNISINYNIYI